MQTFAQSVLFSPMVSGPSSCTRERNTVPAPTWMAPSVPIRWHHGPTTTSSASVTSPSMIALGWIVGTLGE